MVGRGYESSSRPVTALAPPPSARQTNRRCQSCGGAMPARQSRQRDEKGNLVCDSCKANPQPSWTTTHASLSVVDQAEMVRREAEALTSLVRVRRAKQAGRQVLGHDSGDSATIHHCPFCGSGAVIGSPDGTATCDFCHTPFTVQVQPSHPFMPQTIDGEPVTPPGMPGGTPEPSEMSAPSDPTVEETEEDVAADPLGDADPHQQAPAKPNPFEKKDKPKPPGGGGGGGKPPWLKNKSSRTANGSVSCPVCMGEANIEGSTLKHRWNNKGADDPNNPDKHGEYGYRLHTGAIAFRTADGRLLDTEAYMARLALENADDREAVLEQVRVANMAREAASVTCWRCKGEGDTSNGVECDVCRGTGLLDEKTSKTAVNKVTCPTCQGDGRTDLSGRPLDRPNAEAIACPTCGGHGEIDADDPEHFEFREPPSHEGAVRPFEGAGANLTKHQIKAGDIQVGDRLDSSGKTRVVQRHPRTDTVLVKTQTTGARSPSIKEWGPEETVNVWRKS
jgi:hypothetical protein